MPTLLRELVQQDLPLPVCDHAPPRLDRFPVRPRSGSERPPRSLGRRFLTDLVRGSLVIVILNLLVLQVSVVRGHSMEPSLHDGDRLLVDRLSYHLLGVGRFDVVVLRSPIDRDVDYVKRIVGLPGDRVRIEGGRVYVNGRPLTEDFLHIPDRASMEEIVVPPGQYFVLGDNRPISCDSREFGLVAGVALRGKVRVRIWPPARMAVF